MGWFEFSNGSPPFKRGAQTRPPPPGFYRCQVHSDLNKQKAEVGPNPGPRGSDKSRGEAGKRGNVVRSCDSSSLGPLCWLLTLAGQPATYLHTDLSKPVSKNTSSQVNLVRLVGEWPRVGWGFVRGPPKNLEKGIWFRALGFNLRMVSRPGLPCFLYRQVSCFLATEPPLFGREETVSYCLPLPYLLRKLRGRLSPPVPVLAPTQQTALLSPGWTLKYLLTDELF